MLDVQVDSFPLAKGCRRVPVSFCFATPTLSSHGYEKFVENFSLPNEEKRQKGTLPIRQTILSRGRRFFFKRYAVIALEAAVMVVGWTNSTGSHRDINDKVKEFKHINVSEVANFRLMKKRRTGSEVANHRNENN